MRTRIRLTESQLNDITRASVYNVLNDQAMEEGWLSNKCKQG